MAGPESNINFTSTALSILVSLNLPSSACPTASQAQVGEPGRAVDVGRPLGLSQHINQGPYCDFRKFPEFCACRDLVKLKNYL